MRMQPGAAANREVVKAHNLELCKIRAAKDEGFSVISILWGWIFSRNAWNAFGTEKSRDPPSVELRSKVNSPKLNLYSPLEMGLN